MTILFMTKYYPPSEGGFERYGDVLCSDLAAGVLEWKPERGVEGA
jgi:hypothetical protein